jgi:predicted DNA-binding transcriptional regulator
MQHTKLQTIHGGEYLNKDQTLGGAILIICFAVSILYLATLFYPAWLTSIGLQITEADVRFWIIATPVLIAFIAIMAIGAWIGWTMATTPPPKPIEEITSETEKSVEENKTP